MIEKLFTLVRSKAREVRSALWFRPAAACLLAAAAAVAIAAGDRHLPHAALAWLPQVDAATLKELLRLAAGSMLTVATVTLSVLMLVLSIAAGQASPRTVPELMADPVTQNALGTFLATFVFALSSLLLLGFDAIEGAGVALVFLAALALVVLAVKYLVQWIHHVADTLKLNSVIRRVHRQTHRVLEAYLERPREEAGAPDAPGGGDWRDVCCAQTGYVQLVDAEALGGLAQARGLRVRLGVAEGSFVHPPMALMQVAGGTGDEDTTESLRATVVIGADRSAEGDPLLGFELLAEIGSRALSPGINDPQSALTCVGYLNSLLARAAAVPADRYPAAVACAGRVRLIRHGFDAMLERAYRPLARDGAGFAEVSRGILDALYELACCADPGYLDAIAAEGERTLALAMQKLELDQDKGMVRHAAGRLESACARRAQFAPGGAVEDGGH